MIRLGMLIGDRYEILEKIGTGGMADVYKAKDLKLNRFVAVKVLKQEFSENTNFVSKFRVEAQAAAGLMHPNIINVYDVGEEDGIHYIVMELIEGITLKKYIEKKVRLSTKEAISIAIQVAMGIEAAHNNHIIHRDIKPQNIMISKEGKVKVTDFGIAKAATSNTITSNVMGSVHYTSPEQARGGFSDEKSDIYSMGITLFEMLTGRVPFNGDTTVAVAIKHIQNAMPSLRDYVSDVPVGVENIVMKCTQKSPDRRYQNMSDMIKDLKHSLINPNDVIAKLDEMDEVGKTRVAPNVNGDSGINDNTQNNFERVNANTNFINTKDVNNAVSNRNVYSNQNYDDYRSSQKAASVLDTVWEDRVPKREAYADEADLEAIPSQTKSVKRQADKPQIKTDTNKKTVSKKSTNNKPVQSSNTAKNKNSKNNKNKSNSKKTVANNKKQNYTKVNNAKSNMYDYYESEEYAQETVNRQNARDMDYGDSGYDNIEYDYNPKAEKITTIFTVIAAVIIGVILLYFAGKATGIFEQLDKNGLPGNVKEDAERAVMPEFVNVDVKEVKASLNSVGLGCKTVYTETTQYAKDRVISAALEDGQTVLANDKILLNTTIVLTVSAGANGIDVPDVIGSTEAEGTVTLTNAGFKVLRKDEFSTEFPKGQIINQSPEGNSIAALESEVTIVISKGTSDVQVRMPEVLGKTKEAAISTIEASNLVVGQIDESYSSEYPEGQICYQNYNAGSNIAEGTVVDLKISIGSEVTTYSCNLSVDAPSDYIGGNAEVILTTADGSQQLWYGQTATFPVAINISNINSASAYGIVTISYLKNAEEIVTDAEGNQSTQVTQQIAQIQNNVQFTKN